MFPIRPHDKQVPVKERNGGAYDEAERAAEEEEGGGEGEEVVEDEAAPAEEEEEEEEQADDDTVNAVRLRPSLECFACSVLCLHIIPGMQFFPPIASLLCDFPSSHFCPFTSSCRHRAPTLSSPPGVVSVSTLTASVPSPDVKPSLSHMSWFSFHALPHTPRVSLLTVNRPSASFVDDALLWLLSPPLTLSFLPAGTGGGGRGAGGFSCFWVCQHVCPCQR